MLGGHRSLPQPFATLDVDSAARLPTKGKPLPSPRCGAVHWRIWSLADVTGTLAFGRARGGDARVWAGIRVRAGVRIWARILVWACIWTVFAVDMVPCWQSHSGWPLSILWGPVPGRRRGHSGVAQVTPGVNSAMD